MPNCNGALVNLLSIARNIRRAADAVMLFKSSSTSRWYLIVQFTARIIGDIHRLICQSFFGGEKSGKIRLFSGAQINTWESSKMFMIYPGK